MKKTFKSTSGAGLNKFLRDIRTKSGLTQGQVAKALGYSTSQFISNWERGIAEPPIATLRQLASIYSVPVDEMYNVVLKAAIQKATEELKIKFEGKKKS